MLGTLVEREREGGERRETELETDRETDFITVQEELIGRYIVVRRIVSLTTMSVSMNKLGMSNSKTTIRRQETF